MSSSRNVRLSTDAETDVRSILRYSLRTCGGNRRDAYAAALDAAFDRLVLSPSIGRPRDDLFAGCRAFQVQHHVVFYGVEGSEIVVARVLHVKMDPRLRFSD